MEPINSNNPTNGKRERSTLLASDSTNSQVASDFTPHEYPTEGMSQVNTAVNRLGFRIIQGVYTTENPLPIEPELAADLQISRNSLREGIKVLAGKGLVITTRRRGTYATDCQDWNLLDPDILNWYSCMIPFPKEMTNSLIEIRRVIEPAAARMASLRASRDEIAIILAACEEMKATEATDQELYIEADIKFHISILLASHNLIMASFRHALKTLLKISFTAIKEKTSTQTSVNNYLRHHNLALAIASGESQKAFEISEDMLEHTNTLILDLNKSEE